MKKIRFILVAIFLAFFLIQIKAVSANDIILSANNVEIVSQDDIIQDYVKNTGVSYEVAQMTLFPEMSSRTSVTTSQTFVKVNAEVRSSSYPTLYGYVPLNGTHVYFYCETSESGWFRGVKRILYAGYYSGHLAFKGNFQYHLQSSDRIRYTLNGHLYSYTTSTTSAGGQIGIGQYANLNMSVASTSNYYGPLYYHGYRYY